MKKPFLKRLKNKYVIIGLVVIVIAIIWWARSGTAAPTFQSTKAALGTVTEIVSVTGAISPVTKADLAFEKSGTVTKVNVVVGQSVKKGNILATLDSANDQAALAAAKATFGDVSRTLTPQELAVQQAQVVAAQVAVDNASKDAINAAHDSLVKAQGAIFNNTDTFFSNPQSPNPTILIRTPSSATQTSLNTARAALSDTFAAWSAKISTASSTQAADMIDLAHSNLLDVKSFLNSLSSVVTDLSPGNSGMSPAQISAANLSMNTGLSIINATVDSVAAAQAALMNATAAQTQALSTYNLKISGNSSQSIAAQAAKVAQAQALLDQDTLRAPIDGIITKVVPNVGEFAAAGQPSFSIQDNDFKIEANVPEADIAKVSVGNLASTTLDAYGSDINFPAQVVSIDPAETVIEGVPTYKVTLHFLQTDARIRSGMTANLDILTHQAVDTLEIPYRAVIDTAGTKTVRIVSADGKSYTEMPVVTGLKGSDGTIQILSGLSAGDLVVTYVKP